MSIYFGGINRVESAEDALKIIRSGLGWEALDLSYLPMGVNTSDMQRLLIAIQSSTCELKCLEIQQLKTNDGMGDAGAIFAAKIISYCTSLQSLHLGK